MYQSFFNFSFLQAAPFYRAELDPAGLWMAWRPLVASIATAVAMLSLMVLDCWPAAWLAARVPALGRQPLFGLCVGACVVAISAGLWRVFVVSLQMDQVVFLVQVCVSMAFGLFILLVTMEGVPSLRWPQPWRGLVLIGVAAAGAIGLFALYRGVAMACFALGGGASGGYGLELWIASAMLAVTFPAMVLLANMFGFWPLSALKTAHETPDASAATQTRGV